MARVEGARKAADQHDLSTVAFSVLGAGIFGCDSKESLHIEIQAVNQYLANNAKSMIKEVRFVGGIESR